MSKSASHPRSLSARSVMLGLGLAILCSATPAMAQSFTIDWVTGTSNPSANPAQLNLNDGLATGTVTWSDVAGSGVDIRVSYAGHNTSITNRWRFQEPGASTLTMEFFQTGTSDYVGLRNLGFNWTDLDLSETYKVDYVTTSGTAGTIDTSSSYVQLGSLLSTTDIDGGNGVNPDGVIGPTGNDNITNNTRVRLTAIPFGVRSIVISYDSSTGTGNHALYGTGQTGVTVTVEAGVVVTPVSGLTTTEAGGTAQFQVKLRSQPTANVTIPITSLDTTEGTVSAANLTFTTLNYATFQTVTVTGANDALLDGNVAYTVQVGDPSSSDTSYNNLTNADTPDVSLTNLDDDQPVVQYVAATSASGETGTNPVGVRVTFAGGGTLTSAVTVPITVTGGSATGGGTDYSGPTPGSLTFPVGTASGAVLNTTLTITSDALVEGNETVNLGFGAITNGVAGAQSSHVATITDDEAATLTWVNATSTVAENAAGVHTMVARLNISNGGQLQSAATIPLSYGGSASSEDYSSATASITFSAGSLNGATRNVTFNPTNDAFSEGNEDVTIAFNGIPSPITAGATTTHTATIVDNDVAGITVNPTSGLVTTEAGGTATFTIQLNTLPSSNVTITLSSSDTSEGTVGPTTLTFTNGNGTTPQTVTVTGVNDTLPDGDILFTIITNAASSSDGNYNNVNPANVTVTNQDDDPPVVSVTASDPNASEAGPGTGTYTVSRVGPTTAALTVNFAMSGTAASGSDYTSLGTSVTIPAGASSAPVTLTPINDAVFEGSETAILTIQANAAYTVGTPSAATVTIADDDLPVVSIVATDAAASEPGTNTGTYTISRTGTTAGALTVNFATSGTATSGSDYTSLGTSLTIPVGAASATLTLTPLNDAVFEGNETAVVTLQTNASYVVGTPSAATVTIADDDLPTVTVTATDASAAEPGTNTGTYRVSRSGTTAAALTVTFAMSGTATNGTDYGTLGPSVTIPIGAANATLTLTPSNDAVFEGSETAILTLSANAAYTIGSPSAATVTIADDDLPTVTVSATDAAASEPGTNTGTYTFTRSGNTSAALTVNFAMSGTATNGTDYGTLGPSVTFPIGAANATVTLTPTNDAVFEGSETAILTLSANAAYNVGSPSTGTVTIADDDLPTVTVSASDATAAEAALETGAYTVTRSGPTTAALTVNFAMSGTATNGTDYGTLGPSVTIPIGASSASVTLTPIQDTAFEGSETAILTLSTNAAYTIGSPSAATVTISDDDLPTVTVSATDAAASEPGTNTGTYTLSRTGSTSATLTVNFAMSGTATSGSDYGSLGTSATFAIGASTRTVTLTPTNDALVEGPETAIMTLSANAAYTLGSPSTATVTISDDDLPTVTVTASDAAASEPGTNTGTYTVSRTGATGTALTVNYAMSGTATNGTDYGTLGPSVTIPIGASAATVTLTPTNDALVEGNESAILSLTANAAYTLGTPNTATVTIADDDLPVISVAATDASAAEAGSDVGVYTVSRTGPTTAALSVNYVMSGTATDGTDYPTLGTSVTIPIGASSATVTLTPTDDAAFEGSESAILTVQANAAYVVGSPSAATVTIADNDLPQVSVSATDAAAAEAGSNVGVYTLTRTGPTTAALTVNYAMSGTATDGTDYPTLGTSVTIPIGASSATVTLTPTDDALFEGSETATLTIQANAAYTIGTASDSVTIADNDVATVTVLATDAAASEPGTNTGAYTFSRTGPTTAALTVNFAMSGTATNGTDYGTLGPSLTIPIGASSAVLTLTPTNDAAFEGSETATLTISANAAYVVGSPSVATVTIADDDLPTVTVSATDAAASEPGTNTGTYTVSRTGATGAALTVNYSMSGTAISGTDYGSLGTSVTIPIGASSATVTLTPIDDAAFENNETAILTLSANAAYTLGSPSAATVTIIDNDLPTVTVTATDAAASEPGTNTGTYTFTRSGATGAALTVNYSMSGTATSGLDYGSLGTSVTIPIGASSATLTLTPNDDVFVEGDETAILTLSTNAAYTLGTPSAATITIGDNDVPTVTVVATDADASEPGTNTGLFTVSRTGLTLSSLTVNFTMSGTATNGTDYGTLGPSVTIPLGASSATITLTPIDDALAEGGGETAILTLSTNATYSIGSPGTATVTIADDDVPTVTVSASDAAAAEAGSDTGTYTLSRTGATTAALTVNYAMSGTATDGTDYPTLGTSVTIPIGASSATVTLTPTDDAIFEGDETATLTITADAAYSVGAPAAASVTISDNDVATVIVSATDASASEPGTNTGTYTFSRTGPTTAALTVNYAMSGTATDGADYASLGTSITIPVGASSATRTLTPSNDAIFEGDETAILTITANAAYVLGTPSAATVTIADDDLPIVTVNASDAAAAEAGPDTGTYTLSRSGATGAALTVNYAMSGTATDGIDYTSIGTSVTFASGAATATVTLTPIDDALFEGSETATLTVQADAAYTVGSPAAATVTIADDDLPQVSVTATDAAAAEAGSDTGVYTLTRTGATGAALTVNYAMSGTATDGTDYPTLGTSVTIPIGASSATVTLTPTDDAIFEGDETATLTITADAAYTIGTGAANVTISDDDLATVSVSATDASAAEAGSDTGTFTLSRTGPTTAALTVNYAMSGTATDGTDYPTLGTSVTFPIGASAATVTLTPTDDAASEGPETAILTVLANAAYVLGSPSAATITIADNDLPTVTVTASDAAASEPGTNTGAYTISRTGPTTAALTVNYAMSGTASAGTDYTSLGTSVTIPIGASSRVVTLTPLNDAAFEGDETAILTLSADAAYVLGTPSDATVVIADDDLTSVTVSATDASASEAGPDAGVFTISRTGPTTTALSVNYAMSGSASDGADYGTLGTSVTIPIGASSASVTLTPIDDAVFEGDETATLTLGASAGYALGTPGAATVTISDNDLPTVTVSATDAAAAEAGPDTGLFTISRTGPTGAALSVSFAMSGAASDGVDYGTLGTSVTIPVGASSMTLTLTPVDDALFEGSEAATLTLQPNAAYGIGSPSVATVTIADNDLPTVTVSASHSSAAEAGPNTGTFSVTRSGSTAAALTVNYAMSGSASDGADYTSLGTSVTIPIGASSATITLTPTDDALFEGSESATLTISADAAYSLGSPAAATITIADNDLPTVSVVATDAAASEPGTDTGTYTFSRTGPTTAALAVNFAMSGTASDSTDYSTLGTSVTIPIGASSATLTLTPSDDALFEGDETAILTLQSDAAYALGAPSAATVTISDDDLPQVSVSATDASAAEAGPNSGTFTFTRTGPNAAALTVNYGLTGTATDGTDYVSLGTSVTFAIGASSVTRTLTPIDDAISEGDETATLTISANAAYTIGTASANVTISDNDLPTITVSATDASAAEAGSDTGTFTLTRSGPTTAALSVTYAMSGTATDGSDYPTLGTSVTFAVGASSASVTLTPTDDALFEGDETATLTIQSNAAYSLGSPSAATITISDDDLPTVTVVATDAAAAEAGADPGTYTVSRTGTTGAPLTVNYSMSGTAAEGADYGSLGTSVTIPIGASSATLTLTPVDDTAPEDDETAILTLATNAAYTLGSPSAATVTIANDDLPAITVSVTGGTASEAGPTTSSFTVSRTGPTTSNLTINYAVSGTASEGVDFNALGTSVTIPVGAPSATVTVTPIDDALVEGDETVIVTIQSDPAYALGSPATATVTIADDDVPSVTVSATDAAAAEAGPDTGTYTFTRSGATTAALTVNYALSGTATDGADYTSLGTSITIPIGASSATLTLTPIDDALPEGSGETATLTLATSATYSLGSPAAATITISDDDVPTVTVSATDAAAAEAGPDTGTYTVTRTGPTTAALTVNYALSGTASDGTDFPTLGTSVTIPVGASSAAITLTPTDDALAEADETAILTLSANAAYAIGTPSVATVTISDNDLPTVTVTASDASASEAGPDTGQYTISRTGPTTAALAVNYALSGTATDGTDFSTLGTSVSIPIGASSVVVTLTPTDDALFEGSETATLTVQTDAAYLVGAPASADVTISDNDLPAITVNATDAAAAEAGPDTGTFTLTRSGATSAPLTVSFSTSGTASDGSDYTSLGTSLTFPIGASTATLTLTPIDDAAFEGSETAILTIQSNAAYTLGSPASATITIADDDLPQVSVTASDPAASEAGTDPGVYTVTRTGPTTAALSVNYALSGTATSSADYSSLGTSVTIPVGASSATVTLTPIDDALAEGPETATLTIQANAAYTIGTGAATVTISDNDLPAITVSAGDASASEAGPDTGSYTFNRTGPTTAALTVNFALSGTAIDGSDYTSLGTSVTFPIGASSALVTLTPIDDASFEGSETATLTLQAGAGYTVASPSAATVTIADDDLPQVSVTASDAAASEAGPDTGTYTVTRSGPTTAALTVVYAMSGTATDGTDYPTLGTSVTIPTGASSAVVTLTPTDDAVFEGDETATLTISADSAYSVGTASANVTISDNDVATITVSASDASASEAGDPGVYTLTRSGPTTAALTANYVMSGTATDGSDYTSLGTSVSFAIGASTATVTLTPIDDAVSEGDETATLTLQPNAAYVVGAPAAGTVTIADNDLPTLTLSVTDASAAEAGSDTGTFTITRTGPTSAPLTVTYAMSGTASEGTDYGTLGTSVTIPIGASSVTITLTPTDDAVFEGDETATLTLSASAAYTLGAPTVGTITISDDDLPVVTLSATDASAAEAGANTGTYTFSRTGSTAVALAVNYTVSGTATDGVDFATLGTSVTFSAGASTTTLTLTPTDDALVEGDETAIVTLAANAAYSVGTPGTATVAIADDEVPTVTVSATDAAAAEAGSDVGVYTLTRTGATTAALTVQYVMSGTATDGTDYPTLGTSVTIPVGASSATVTLTPTDDAIPEGSSETATLTLTASANYSIGTPAAATVTIADDDAPTVTLSATDAAAAEAGSDVGVYTVTRTGATTAALTVNYALSGTASDGADFPTLGTSVTIPIGASSATVTLTPTDDALFEGDETATLTLQADAAYVVGTPSAGTVTISDNDLPSVTVSASDASAAEAGSDPGSFTISRSGPTSAALTVTYAMSGTATDGTDYPTLGTSVMIPVGASSAAVTLTPIDDALFEGSEVATLTLQSNAAYTLGTPSAATVTISDNDTPTVTVSATDAAAAEAGSDVGVYTLTRTGPTTAALTVNYAMSGTASDGADYPTLGTSVTIPVGASSAAVTLTPIDDAAFEGSETATLTLQSNAAYTLGTPSAATVTISDDDVPTVTVSASDASAAEAGSDPGTYTFTRSGPTTAALTVNYAMSGTATDGADFPTLGTSVTFAIGASSATVTLTPTNDTVFEGDEIATLTVQPNAAYAIGTGAANVTISDNDVPTVTLSATDASAAEAGPDTGTFTFTRSGPTTAALTINFAMSGVAADGVDYTTLGTSVTIPIGASSTTLTLTPIDDALLEGDETATLTVQANAAYAIGAASGDVVISDDEVPSVSVTASDANASEPGADTGTFTFTRTGPTTAVLTLVFAMSGTASDGTDFATLGTTVTIPSGASSATLTLTPTDDALVEGPETATLTIQANAAYVIGTASASVSLADDEFASVSVAASDSSAAEAGSDPGTYTFTRTGPTSAALTINYAMSGTATDGTDYPTLGTSVTIPIGATSATLTLTPTDDALLEGDEIATLTVQPNAAYSIAGASADVTISDDDVPTVTVSASDASAAEAGADTATYTFTRSGATTAPLTVNYLMSGTASDGVDYGTLGTSVTFPIGAATATLTLTPIDDGFAEGSETATLTVQPNAAYSAGGASATATIADDDSIGITVTPTNGLMTTEAGGTATFTVRLNSLPTSDVTITLSSSDTGEATVTPATLTFTSANGTTAQTVTVTGVDDGIADGDVALTIVTSAAASADASYNGQAVADVSVTNADDETGGQFAFSAAGYAVSEDGVSVTITVTRSNGSATPATVNYATSDQTATAGVDYTSTAGTLSFAVGETSKTFTVPVSNDPLIEGFETIGLALSVPTGGAALGVQSFATITLNDESTPQIVTPSLPGGQVGSPYGAPLSLGDGGRGPFAWSISSGSFPPGLSLSGDGRSIQVSGTPTQAGTYTFEVTAIDALGGTATRSYTVVIGASAPTTNPEIGDQAPPRGTVRQPYDFRPSLQNGAGPFTWSIASGALPPGLSFDPTTGRIAGTPTQTGTFTICLQVTDSNSLIDTTPTGGCAAGEEQTFAIDPDRIQIGTVDLPDMLQGAPYGAPVELSDPGVGATYTWTVSAGALPPGLSLSGTGPQVTVLGTPTAPGTYTFTLQASDDGQGGATDTQTYVVQVGAPNSGASVQLQTPSLPKGTAGAAYSTQLVSSGGVGPYSYALSGGTLPAGLTLSSSGVISGTPSAGGTSSITVTVTDQNGQTSTRTYALTVANPPQITTSALPAGVQNNGYAAQVQGINGVGPFIWTVVGGIGPDAAGNFSGGGLPAGLVINQTSGVISGTPTAAPGTYPLSVQLTDREGVSVTRALSIEIVGSGAAPAVVTQNLSGGTVSQPYAQTLQATGGTPGYTWALTSGTLPAGLSLDPTTGVVSGVPTTPGTSNLVFTVTDQTSATASSVSLSLTISDPVAIATTTLPPATTGSAYSTPLSGTGGVGPYTWTLLGGALPTGLSLSGGGLITGSTGSTGSFPLVLRLTDSQGKTSIRTLTLQVQAPATTPGPTTPPTLQITTITLPGGVVGIPYDQPIQVTGGVGPFTFVSNGGLPPGLSLDPSSGRLSGTPNGSGSFSFTVTVMDQNGLISSRTFTVAIAVAPAASGGLARSAGNRVQGSGGCQVSPSASSGGAAWFVLLLLALFCPRWLPTRRA